ncbi:MAG: hypothetical protein IT334_04335 [Thermomicrobiales bacterium]|nr:hypothetical protein [Thermomicrobiales bacterium]
MKQRFRSRLFRSGLVMMILSLALVGPTGAIALFQQIGNDASPASGHAAIVAQGVSFLPEGSAAWRIVEDTAEPLDVAVPETRALGFTVAVNDGVLVNDYSFGAQTRVAAGEAAFNASGVAQQRASISGGNAPYLRIGLVPASEASDAGGDRLVYSGNGFTAPQGRRDIDLLRDVLQQGDESRVGAGTAPSLVHIINGSATIDTGNDTFDLAAGESADVDGEFAVIANQNDTVFVAAIIGAEVPAMPRFSGSLTLDIRACPAGITGDQLRANAANGSDAGFSECEPLEDAYRDGVRINLNLPDGERLRLNEAEETDEPGVVVWEPLVFGDYVLGRVTEFPDGYGDYLITDGNLGVVQRGNFTIDRNNLDFYRVVYLLQEPVADGALTVNYFSCTVDSMNEWSPDACEPMDGGTDTELIINNDASQTLADADQLDTGVYQWSDLPVATTDSPMSADTGSYLIAFEPNQNTAPPDTNVTVEGAEWMEGAGAYQFKLTPSQPNATVNYYYTTIGEVQTTGTLQVVGVVCPDADSTDAECDANGTIALPDVTVTVLEAGDVLTPATAEIYGDAYVWPNLAFGLTWVLSADNIELPAGYSLARIANTNTGETGNEVSHVFGPSTYTVFAVYLIQDEAADDDSDGLSNDDETNIHGTDPQDPDTDGDCFSDGLEVTSGTDPLDDADFPANGSCDINA